MASVGGVHRFLTDEGICGRLGTGLGDMHSEPDNNELEWTAPSLR